MCVRARACVWTLPLSFLVCVCVCVFGVRLSAMFLCVSMSDSLCLSVRVCVCVWCTRLSAMSVYACIDNVSLSQ